MFFELIAGAGWAILPIQTHGEYKETHEEIVVEHYENNYHTEHEYVEAGVIIDDSCYSDECAPMTVVETPTEATTEEIEYEVIEFQNTTTYYGSMTITAYAPTGSACADGAYPSVGYTAASNDPNLWHRWVYIEGVGDRYIHDTGGMGSGVIDVYVGSYEEAVQFGSWTGEVYVYE